MCESTHQAQKPLATLLALLSTDRSEYQWRIARIPPARTFVGDSSYSQLSNRCHLRRVKRSREGLGRAEGCILFGEDHSTPESATSGSQVSV